jgi:hypothetical protein
MKAFSEEIFAPCLRISLLLVLLCLVLTGCSSNGSSTAGTASVQRCESKISTGLYQLIGAAGNGARANQVTLHLIVEYGPTFTEDAILPLWANALPIAKTQGPRAALLQAQTKAQQYCQAHYGPISPAVSTTSSIPQHRT